MPKNFEIFTVEEFIAAIIQHIPDKNFQLLRYYGWYSNRSRGDRNKAGIQRPGEQPACSAQSLDETVFFPDAFKRFCQHVDADRAYLLYGRVESEFETPSLTVEQLRPVKARG